MTAPIVDEARRLVVFQGGNRLIAGSVEEATATARQALASRPTMPILAFDARTGGVVDLDMREVSPDADTRAEASDSIKAAPRGRPRLGVVAREVTLLPRHWEWLASQSGGASASLRRLVDAARKARGEEIRARDDRDAAYRFMSAIAGDEPGFEEASRALFAGDTARLALCIASWPADVQSQVMDLLHGT